MSVIYFAFANDEQRPLANLQAESREIDRMLRPLDQKGAFKLIIDAYATLPEVMRKLVLYENELVLFHFSGHADRNLLQMEDGVSYAKGVGEQLGCCRQLQLVVLNGCKTQDQVRLLHDLGIPAVIATPYEVEDVKALQFSQAFYESLSQFLQLKTAFDRGANRVLANDEKVAIQRDLALHGASAYLANSWQLAIKADHEDHVRWTLPDDRTATLIDDFTPNELLIETLAESLAPFNDELRSIVEQEKDGMEVELFEKREAIVKCLPHPVGDGIRKLVAQPTDADHGEQQFYDQADTNRLRQLALVFEIVIELLTFILLAQLWEEMDPADEREPSRRLLRFSPEEVRPIRDFLQLPEQDLEGSLHLIIHLRNLFEQYRLTYFIDELSGMDALFREGHPFYTSCLWLSRLHKSLQLQPPTEQQGRSLCRSTEEHLCEVLRQLGFIARYTFASVKNIDLVKYRHRKHPVYHHKVVSLIMRITGLGEKRVPMERYFDSKSVLLLKGDPNRPKSLQGELNLTPFVVDENAFNPDAKLAKLHFFRRCLPETDSYAYRFIYLLDDLPLIVQSSDKRTKMMHKVLSGQFKRFDELLNAKPKPKAL
ncbi:MAG: CHAT domain-containing protein [Saprospiraceae bacterium]|nr:CHAT domain-containing protein [Lewinella sp.]